MRIILKFLLLFVMATSGISPAKSLKDLSTGVRIKDLARLKGVRENPLVGYGLVVGLAGTGDSSRSRATIQSLVNTLASFDVSVRESDMQSRNVASVMITAVLAPFSESGDAFDINVSSMGDAKSLQGGTLLLAPLKAANGKIYALAQGQLSVGGYQYDAFGNSVQKNHPTVGSIPKGAIAEKDTVNEFYVNETFKLILNDPDFTTVSRIVDRVNSKYSDIVAQVLSAGKIGIKTDKTLSSNDLARLISSIENTQITPDMKAKVVINERTGTVVSGGDVRISSVTISHGNLKLKIDAQYSVSQPNSQFRPSANIATTVVPVTDIKIEETTANALSMDAGTTVEDLLTALRAMKLSTRDIIIVLQTIKQAGALHAELIIT